MYSTVECVGAPEWDVVTLVKVNRHVSTYLDSLFTTESIIDVQRINWISLILPGICFNYFRLGVIVFINYLRQRSMLRSALQRGTPTCTQHIQTRITKANRAQKHQSNKILFTHIFINLPILAS